MAKLLEGKSVSERIKSQLRKEIKEGGNVPVLSSIMVGENPGSYAYVRSQQKTAADLGVEYRFLHFQDDIDEEELIECVRELNNDVSVNGIIVQFPLPAHIDHKRIIEYISPDKDTEGMHPANIGKIISGQARIMPCTAAAVMELLRAVNVDLYGRETVIVGHSEIVGKPLALLLLEKLATVTVCHIGTSVAGRLDEHVRNADILIVAVGKAEFIRGELIKEGAVVIDVGINRQGSKIVGDVAFGQAQKRASYITPVPGGVGPLTVVMLMRNLVELMKPRA